MDPLLDREVLVNSIKMAELHHPIKFNSNLLKFRNALSAGDYERAGKYAGKDMAYLIAEIPDGNNVQLIRELEQFTDSFWYHAFGIPL